MSDDVKPMTREKLEDIARFGEAARKRGDQRLITAFHDSNVLAAVPGLGLSFEDFDALVATARAGLKDRPCPRCGYADGGKNG